jgi:hypothetical protein
MEYKGYIITNGKVIKKGDSRESTEGVNIDEIQSIEKSLISKRKLLTIGFLSLVLLVSLAGAIPSPVRGIAMLGSFVFIAATVLSAFVTDRYVLKTRNDKLAIPAKGSKGKAFMNEINKKAGHTVASEVDYGTQQDPFVDSGRQVQLNTAAVLLIVFGSLLAIGVVGPMYSDQITWEKVTNVVEAMGGGPDGDTATVYEQQDDNQNVFESQYATVEFSQGQEDLDEADQNSEKYVTLDVTIRSRDIYGVNVQIADQSQAENFIPFATSVDNDSWARYGSLEGEMVPDDVSGNTPPQIIPYSPTSEKHIGVTQTVSYREVISGRGIQLETPSERFVKGYTFDNSSTGFEEADSADELEVPDPPNLIGFQEGDTVRVVGSVPDQSGQDLREVVLANYTVN